MPVCVRRILAIEVLNDGHISNDYGQRDDCYALLLILCFTNNITGSSTLPRATTRATETEGARGDKVAAATSSTSLYDNVASGNQNNQANAQGR